MIPTKNNNPFWQFSLTIWQDKDLQHRLIQLQDEQAVDVNLCLFALWLSRQGQSIETVAEKALQTSAYWQDEFIQPLRTLRRKSVGDNIQSLKSKLMKAELQAEQAEQEALYLLQSEVFISSENFETTLKTNLQAISQHTWPEAQLSCMQQAIQRTMGNNT